MNRLYINKDWSTLKKLLALKAAGGGSVPQTKTATGSLVTFDTTKTLPLIECVAGIEPVQDLHGYDSPWPAGGGVNLLDISLATPASETYGLTKSIDSDGYVHLDGTVTINDVMFIAIIRAGTSQIDQLTGKGYIISLTDVSGCTVLSTWGLRDIDNGSIACSIESPGSGNEMHAKFRVVVSTAKVTTYSPYSNICPISGWTGAKVYHSGADTSNPTVLDITFPSEAGTVYGGMLDVINGTLTVDRATVDLGTLDWTYNNSQLSMVSQNLSGTVGDGANVICSKYKTETNLQGAIWANVDKAVAINKANCTTTGNFSIGALVVKDTDYTDAAAFKTAMSGVQLCYELATPTTYTLTPQEVTTLLGTNNIWSDAGDITVKYYE